MTSAAKVMGLKRRKRTPTSRMTKASLANVKKAQKASRWCAYYETMRVNRMKIGDFTRSPCGCLVKLVAPHQNTYTVKPLCVYENDLCEELAEDTPFNSSIGNVEMKMDGSWRSRTPGYKQHLIGTQIYLPDDVIGVRLDPKKLLQEWRIEWALEDES